MVTVHDVVLYRQVVRLLELGKCYAGGLLPSLGWPQVV